MRNTLVLAACLLLTVGSLDARTLRKKHTVELPEDVVVEVAGSRQVSHQIAPECEVAKLRVRTQCGDPLDATSEGDLLNKLMERDLPELCSQITRWFQCANEVFSACEAIDDPALLNVMTTVVSYVCEEKLNVINRHKACLLRVDNDEHAAMPVLLGSVGRSCMSLIGQLSDPPCPAREAQACAKNVIAQQCGEEIAVVLDGLADRVRTAAGCPTSRLRSTAHMKRQGFPYHSYPLNFFKSFI